MLGGAIDLVDAVNVLRLSKIPAQQMREADDRVHRRAHFVAHVGEEGALRPVGAFGFIAGFRQFDGALMDQGFQMIVMLLQFRIKLFPLGDVLDCSGGRNGAARCVTGQMNADAYPAYFVVDQHPVFQIIGRAGQCLAPACLHQGLIFRMNGRQNAGEFDTPLGGQRKHAAGFGRALPVHVAQIKMAATNLADSLRRVQVFLAALQGALGRQRVRDVALQAEHIGLATPFDAAGADFGIVDAAILAALNGLEQIAFVAHTGQLLFQIRPREVCLPVPDIQALNFFRRVAQHGGKFEIGLEDAAVLIEHHDAVTVVFKQRASA